jgi:outer membrane protein
MRGSKVVLVMFLLWAQLAWCDDLMSTYKTAISGDIRLKLASAKVGLGLAGEKQATGELLPQVRGIATWSENRQDLEKDPSLNIAGSRESFAGERYSLVLSQPLFNMPKYHKWRRGQAITQQYRSEQDDMTNQLVLDVVEGYFMVLQAEDVYTMSNQEIEAVEGVLAQVEKLHERQLAKITELLEVQATLDKLRADQVEAKGMVEIARERLHEITGREPGNLAQISEKAKFLPMAGTLEEWLAKVKANSASLAGLASSINAESHGLKEQKTARLPAIDLQASHQKSDLGFENSPRPTTSTDVLSVNFSMPIFTSGVISGRISEANQKLVMARYEYEAQHRLLVKEARGALLQTNASARRISASERAVESAKKSVEAMEKGFRLGAVTTAEVLDAQRNYFQANGDLKLSRYDYIINRSRLLRVSGTANEYEIDLMNQWLQ